MTPAFLRLIAAQGGRATTPELSDGLRALGLGNPTAYFSASEGLTSGTWEARYGSAVATGDTTVGASSWAGKPCAEFINGDSMAATAIGSFEAFVLVAAIRIHDVSNGSVYIRVSLDASTDSSVQLISDSGTLALRVVDTGGSTDTPTGDALVSGERRIYAISFDAAGHARIVRINQAWFSTSLDTTFSALTMTPMTALWVGNGSAQDVAMACIWAGATATVDQLQTVAEHVRRKIQWSVGVEPSWLVSSTPPDDYWVASDLNGGQILSRTGNATCDVYGSPTLNPTGWGGVAPAIVLDGMGTQYIGLNSIVQKIQNRKPFSFVAAVQFPGGRDYYDLLNFSNTKSWSSFVALAALGLTETKTWRFGGSEGGAQYNYIDSAIAITTGRSIVATRFSGTHVSQLIRTASGETVLHNNVAYDPPGNDTLYDRVNLFAVNVFDLYVDTTPATFNSMAFWSRDIGGSELSDKALAFANNVAPL